MKGVKTDERSQDAWNAKASIHSYSGILDAVHEADALMIFGEGNSDVVPMQPLTSS